MHPTSSNPDLSRRTLLRTLLSAPLLAAARLDAAVPSPRFGDRSFEFLHEFYGPQGYNDPQAAANLQNRMTSGLTLWPPVDSGFTRFVSDLSATVMLHLAGSTVPGRLPVAYIERQRSLLNDIATSDPDRRVIWNLMAEWDQSGGNWVPNGRPHYTGLTRAEACARFLDYYRTTCQPLATYLAQATDDRGYTLCAITDYSPNAIYAYELGVEICLLERAIDELGDLSTGIAFIRGAARQMDRQWGIDISTWRTSNNSATEFDDRGVLVGGWSPSYLKRHYYAAYMSGAHIVQNEASVYYDRFNRLNPFGQVAREFADFALRRHTDVGRPAVLAALMVDHYSGFDPKHSLYNQSDYVWYQDIPYVDGDYMIHNLLKVAYPNHWLHGLTPGAPFADAAGRPNTAQFRAYLARGGDPRPYEPMPSTRWGDSFDILTNHASADVLAQYRVIVLLGDVALDKGLRDALEQWVRNGGVLVVNARQIPAGDPILGVDLLAETRTSNQATWLRDSTVVGERSFRYTPVTVNTATVLATAANGDALVTSNPLGKGEVLFCAPHYLQTTARDQLLGLGAKLFDWLNGRFAAARVSGSVIEFIVNLAPGRVIVTLINNTAYDWYGSVFAPNGAGFTSAREYCADTAVAFTAGDAETRIDAQVPAYDVRVYAFES